MNTTRTTQGAGTIERVLRQHLSQPGNAVQEAADWDSSNVSRFLADQQGVPVGKIDAVVGAAGYVLISRRYFDAIGTLARWACIVTAHAPVAVNAAQAWRVARNKGYSK